MYVYKYQTFPTNCTVHKVDKSEESKEDPSGEGKVKGKSAKIDEREDKIYY